MRSGRGYVLVGLVFLFAALMQARSGSGRLLPDVGGGVDVPVTPGYQLFKVQNKGGKQVDLEHVNRVGILPAIPFRDNPTHKLVDIHIDDKVHVDSVDMDSQSAPGSTHTSTQENWH